MLLHKTHVGIRDDSLDPRRHQCCFTRPTLLIGWVSSDFLFSLDWVEGKNWRFGFFFFFFSYYGLVVVVVVVMVVVVVLVVVVAVVTVADCIGG